jgi:hypothetical protein
MPEVSACGDVMVNVGQIGFFTTGGCFTSGCALTIKVNACCAVFGTLPTAAVPPPRGTIQLSVEFTVKE